MKSAVSRWDIAAAADRYLPARVAHVAHIVRNAAIDTRFGKPLALGYLRNQKQSSSDYAVLAKLFDGRIESDDVLVDIGAGSGRVINQWLRMGLSNKMYGVEIDPATSADMERRLRRHHNVEIIQGDAIENLPADGTFFYFFNPFDRPTTMRLADAFVELQTSGGPIREILYYNCKHVDVFEDDERFSVTVEVLDHPQANGQQVATIALVPADSPA